MEIKWYKININKRFIASSIALDILPSTLTEWTTNSFQFIPDENGQVVTSGHITYNTLKKYYFVEIDNPEFDKIKYYTANSDKIKTLDNLIYMYTDILTDKEVFEKKKMIMNILMKYILIEILKQIENL